MQIKAKELNTHQVSATFFLIFFCVAVFLILSNINLIFKLLSDNFQFAKFLSNVYVKLSASIVALILSIPILAKLKTIREVWFILKTKSVHEIKYSIVRNTIKKIGLIKYTRLYVQLWLRNIFWFTLLVSPTSVLIYLWVNSVLEGSATKEVTFLMALGVTFLLLNSLSAYFCIRQKYCLCYWLIIQRKDLTAKQVIKESARFMDNKCIDLFVYKLRFVAWFLLCIVFIPAISYVYPYYKQASAVYAFEILSHRNNIDGRTVTFERIKL